MSTPSEKPDPTAEELREEIEATRAELGDTVSELAAKTDVNGRAQGAAQDIKENVSDKASAAKQGVTERQHEFVSAARDATPDSAVQAGAEAKALAKRNSPVLAVAAAVALAFLIGRRSAR